MSRSSSSCAPTTAQNRRTSKSLVVDSGRRRTAIGSATTSWCCASTTRPTGSVTTNLPCATGRLRCRCPRCSPSVRGSDAGSPSRVDTAAGSWRRSAPTKPTRSVRPSSTCSPVYGPCPISASTSHRGATGYSPVSPTAPVATRPAGGRASLPTPLRSARSEPLTTASVRCSKPAPITVSSSLRPAPPQRPRHADGRRRHCCLLVEVRHLGGCRLRPRLVHLLGPVA